MPTITAIEPQQHDQNRVNVYLDGSFGFGATLMMVYARNLVVGRELTGDEIQALDHDDEIERALGAALNFISFRPRSAREVRDYFRRKKTEPDVADAVVERLQRTGLLDDREFARFWVENRQTFRPRGARALKAEMRQKGVDNEVIEEALESIEDEEETAYQVGARKARSLRASDERDFLTKMLGFLQRRGFAYADAAAASKRLYADLHEREPETMDLADSDNA